MLQEIAVEFICFTEIVPDVSAVGFPDISIKIVAVRRMSAVVDNLFRPLHRSYPAKVRESLFGHYDLHRMFIAVDVRAHGNDTGNPSAHNCRWTYYDRYITVPGKFPASADAVHYVGPEQMGRVHVAVDIHLDCRIDGYNSEAADNSCVI